MSKHSDGPWKVVNHSGQLYIERETGRDDLNAHFEFIAIIHKEWMTDAKTKYANARLIAAAPDLLAYLKEAHQEEIDNNHYGDGSKDCSYCRAIASAEGK
jgi:hypothetical protein